MFRRIVTAAATLVFLIVVLPAMISAQEPGDVDPRKKPLKNLNGYFPFQSIDSIEDWSKRKEAIKQRILVSQGLWPLPTKTDLNAVVHGSVERDDYTVHRVFMESAPGHFLTGSLYRPKNRKGPFPAVLSPHGHWNQGRFYDAGEALVEQEVQGGAEVDEIGGRFPLQARAVQLARMGVMVFFYDMTGNADSLQIAHRPERWNHLDRSEDWGFMSVQADLRLQNMMGLQTWNSIRALDFLCERDDVDQSRIGITGASGGGTQTMILSAIDDRISASMPCVMVSTAMQGGCTCENAPLLRINQGNVDIAAAFAPKPLALTAADDWTIELREKGFPDLIQLYEMLGIPANLKGVFRTEFKHNYNLVNRTEMYHFFNKHFGLGYEEPIVERYYEPLNQKESTVWTDKYPAPSGDQIGDSHEVRLLRLVSEDSDAKMAELVRSSGESDSSFNTVIGGAWATIIGRSIDEVGDITTDVASSKNDDTVVTAGKVIRRENGEQVFFKRWSVADTKRGVALVITDRGIRDFEVSDNSAVSIVKQECLARDIDVIACDLFIHESGDTGSQPMWYQPNGDQGWKRFSGYTYGYNHSLFVKRVHDVLSLVKYAQQTSKQPIHLVGLGAMAGPIAAAARSQLGDAIDKTFIDTHGFKFRELKTHNDPMFVPGAVKYLGVDGLLALCSPYPVACVSNLANPFPVTRDVYTQSNSQDEFIVVVNREDAADYLSAGRN